MGKQLNPPDITVFAVQPRSGDASSPCVWSFRVKAAGMLTLASKLKRDDGLKGSRASPAASDSTRRVSVRDRLLVKGSDHPCGQLYTPNRRRPGRRRSGKRSSLLLNRNTCLKIFQNINCLSFTTEEFVLHTHHGSARGKKMVLKPWCVFCTWTVLCRSCQDASGRNRCQEPAGSHLWSRRCHSLAGAWRGGFLLSSGRLAPERLICRGRSGAWPSPKTLPA